MRDAQSFDEFYRATAVRTLRYAVGVVGDATEAQDAVQEAYARAWRRWDTVAAHPAPEAWVRLVVSRLATDRWRRISGIAALLRRTGPPPPAPPPDENTVLLVEALRALPANHRRALALHYLCDRSVDEIAAEIGAKPNTVKSWLARGRERLALQLAGTGFDLEAQDA
ncbi:RNA polymerase sigma24 factor [Asanoa ishikariensis]|uniref:RNA polymerase sigma-70 factor, ECF subfamily n=1 Tax=Asanoa ishikariensis TaxID=137265 RepID=A0A1H3TDM8_9ACTN|nr:sigma-70 family RNA polymerase sigma factor [Asanoa ishikariensis]GIF62670.1 RNA polymerase sigma24 factor [Asanoa ishikariensis]SDZ48057.1 RNA polymerase sigma-70 factor, ECF subfamily [Asanoa ishikariensis]